jgi:hypothetical protein
MTEYKSAVIYVAHVGVGVDCLTVFVASCVVPLSDSLSWLVHEEYNAYVDPSRHRLGRLTYLAATASLSKILFVSQFCIRMMIEAGDVKVITLVWMISVGRMLRSEKCPACIGNKL